MIDSDRDRLLGILAACERGDGDAALRRRLAKDPEASAIVGGDRMVDRLLRYACTTDLGEEEFTRGVIARIDAERRGDAHVRRAARRLPVRKTPPGTAWVPMGLTAACILLGLMFGLGERTPAPARKMTSRIETATPVRKSDPMPTPPPRRVLAETRPIPEPVLVAPEPRRPEPIAPEPEPAPAVIVTPTTPRTTVATIGTVERAEGQSALLAGQTVETGPKGFAVLRLLDGTRIELAPETSLVTPEGNKRFVLSRGALLADVAKQPKGAPLIFGTPNAEATVLGTTLRLTVADGEKGLTRLEVLEGKVRLLRALDGKTVDVPTGHFAVAAPGTDLKTKALPDPRVTDGLRALYLFEEGKGRVIRDVSGVGAPLHLVAKDGSDIDWLPGGGIVLGSPTLIASSGPATKIVGACRTSRAVTVEAWIRPAQAEKGTLRYVVSLSGSRKESLAFGLGLNADIGTGPTTYRATLTTPKTLPLSDLMPSLESTPVVPAFTHVVFTRTASGLAALYVDGVERASGPVEGDFSTWSDTLRVILGDYSFEGIRPWLGEFHLLAFYSRALQPDEVSQNLDAGRRKFASRK